METFRNTAAFVLLVSLFFLSTNSTAGWWNSSTQCGDVAQRGHLNVLTFNLLFLSEQASVEERLQPLVEFLKNQEVDVMFLQEVVGGKLALSEFTNSAKILQEWLSSLGLEYNLRTAFEIGIPGVFYTGNATLSRCEIKYSIVKRLPRKSEVEILGRVVKLPRNVQMTRIKIPGFGKFNTYNTQMCAGCPNDERNEQLSVLFDFLNNVENVIPGVNPLLLAGDFNADRSRDQSESDSYDSIIDKGFIDAYAEGECGTNDEDCLNELCEFKNDPDVHCTVGVTAFDLPDGGTARRIDYIFSQGFGKAKNSEVFFNPVEDESEPEELTSDHAAVYVEIPLFPSSQ